MVVLARHSGPAEPPDSTGVWGARNAFPGCAFQGRAGRSPRARHMAPESVGRRVWPELIGAGRRERVAAQFSGAGV